MSWLAAFMMWLMWFCIYLSQMNPQVQITMIPYAE